MHLRIAITTARPQYENWTSPENVSLLSRLDSLLQYQQIFSQQAIWVQDFPALYPAAPTAETNPTHTSFTSDFFNFVGGGSTLALNSANMSFVETARYFDFSASEGTRIVKSVGGSFEGEVALKLAGGLDSSAKAIKSFEPEFVSYCASSLTLSEKLILDHSIGRSLDSRIHRQNLISLCLSYSGYQ